MNSKTLENFGELENSNIPYFGGYQEIGDFCLEKNKDDKKIIEDAKVGYTIYGTKNIEELKNTKKKIIVVIPALTGTSKIFDTNPSQGDGWANFYGENGEILDPNENIIIGLDYFGSGFNNHPDKHNLDFYPVPPEKQVEAWKKALKKLGIKNIDILFGGSNGGGHIHHWVLQKDKSLEPNFLISIAGPIAPTDEAKEFFKIQYDFLEKIDVSNRLEKNLIHLRGQSKLYDFLIDETKKEIQNNYKSDNDKKIMKIVRQIGFLKFVGPNYFDKFLEDINGNKLNLNEAQQNLLNYFEKEGIKFEKRFGKSYLKILLKGIFEAKRISPKEYANKISKKINLIILSQDGDTLFEAIPMWKYFMQVKNIREEKNHTGITKYENIKHPLLYKAGHDGFLWKEIIKTINNKIKNILKYK